MLIKDIIEKLQADGKKSDMKNADIIQIYPKKDGTLEYVIDTHESDKHSEDNE